MGKFSKILCQLMQQLTAPDVDIDTFPGDPPRISLFHGVIYGRGREKDRGSEMKAHQIN